jgi:hypothetical protein
VIISQQPFQIGRQYGERQLRVGVSLGLGAFVRD